MTREINFAERGKTTLEHRSSAGCEIYLCFQKYHITPAESSLLKKGKNYLLYQLRSLLVAMLLPSKHLCYFLLFLDCAGTWKISLVNLVYICLFIGYYQQHSTYWHKAHAKLTQSSGLSDVTHCKSSDSANTKRYTHTTVASTVASNWHSTHWLTTTSWRNHQRHMQKGTCA